MIVKCIIVGLALAAATFTTGCTSRETDVASAEARGIPSTYAAEQPSLGPIDEVIVRNIRLNTGVQDDNARLLMLTDHVCSVLRRRPSEAGVQGVEEGLAAATGWTEPDAHVVVNAAIVARCPNLKHLAKR